MICELIDTELETVAGGLLDVTSFAHSFNTVTASNSAPQVLSGVRRQRHRR